MGVWSLSCSFAVYAAAVHASFVVTEAKLQKDNGRETHRAHEKHGNRSWARERRITIYGREGCKTQLDVSESQRGARKILLSKLSG